MQVQDVRGRDQVVQERFDGRALALFARAARVEHVGEHLGLARVGVCVVAAVEDRREARAGQLDEALRADGRERLAGRLDPEVLRVLERRVAAAGEDVVGIFAVPVGHFHQRLNGHSKKTPFYCSVIRVKRA